MGGCNNASHTRRVTPSMPALQRLKMEAMRSCQRESQSERHFSRLRCAWHALCWSPNATNLCQAMASGTDTPAKRRQGEGIVCAEGRAGSERAAVGAGADRGALSHRAGAERPTWQPLPM